jgi:choline-sulfatase
MPESLPRHPNLVAIITDQERPPMHWPQAFTDSLPSRARMLRHGISFERAVCNTCMCSPSRATFMTGLMPAQHGVTDTLTDNGPFSATETVLDPELPTLGSMLRDGGYEIAWVGKWHLSKSPSGSYDKIGPEALAEFGFEGWIPPDAGGDTKPENFGGGRADHDSAYLDAAIAYLEEKARNPGERPFFLAISLVNPHDVLAFPRDWDSDYDAADLEGSVQLPASVDEDLATNHKPSVHAAMKPAIDFAVGPLETAEDRLRYVNFYANLTAKMDRQLGPILDFFSAADGTPTPLGEDTVIVRFADHGEMAMSHGGLRQKVFNVYEESMRVPLILSNPRLFPEGRTCDHPASLVDLVPTLASLLDVDPPPGVAGTDLSPMILDPDHGPVQDAVLFTFDDMHAGTGLVEEILPGMPGRIRCIREARFKYARYFNADGAAPDEHELYDLQEDPDELENLAHPEHPRYGEAAVVAERERLAAKLADAEARLAG